MLRANATPRIALVQHKRVVNDDAVGEFPRESVRANNPAIRPVQYAVAALIQGACPQPARVGFLDVLPEAIDDGATAVVPVQEFAATASNQVAAATGTHRPRIRAAI